MKQSIINNSNIKKCLPAFSKKCIPIVLACNDNYVKYLSVTIQSIIDNASADNNYDIIVLYTQVSKSNQKMVIAQTSHLPNFSCRFIDVKEIISRFKLRQRTHITEETFYRILTIDLLKDYPKVIYIDCDLVIDEDIANLFNTDVSKYYLAACRDVIGIGISYSFYGIFRKIQYNKLHLKNYHEYFNAGVMLMNLSLINKNFTSTDILEVAEEKKFPWMDQDVLNFLFEEKILLLDDRWNMTNHYKHRNEIKHVPKEIYEKWDSSSKHASIYHFAGSKVFKPWFNPFDYPAEYFWKYAYKTPFYKSFVNDLLNRTIFKSKKEKILATINRYIKNAKE